MKHKLEGYKRIREDLIRQVDLCHEYKERIQDTLEEFQRQFEAGLIDKKTYWSKIYQFLEGKHPDYWYSTYDDHIDKCSERIRYYEEKINEITEDYDEKRNSFSKIFMFIGIISLIFSILFFVQPTITGLIPYSAEPGIIFEDGYTKEGSHWMEIKGSRVYERCLEVNSEIGFDSVKIIGKITSAVDKKDLVFGLYNDANEPSELIGSCKVDDYDDVWKSCSLGGLEQDKGRYWICAASPSGDSDRTYYTIAYQKGDSRKSALWTGQNWQKLDRASYTIKAQFIQNE